MSDPTRDTQLSVLMRRQLTRAGNKVALPVTNGATTKTYTLPLAEQDTSYGVHVIPNWNTTVWVTGKTTTQCTINFGTAAGASAFCDVNTFREP